MLALEETIIESHNDFNSWASVCTGFDEKENLLIKLTFQNNEEGGSQLTTTATIDADTAYQMAAYLKISLTRLPQFILKKFGNESKTASPTEVKSLFYELLNFVTVYKGHYRISRTETDL